MHWKGWVLLLIISTAPALGGLAMKRWVPGFGPEHVFLYLIASFVAVFGLLAALLRTRGRERR